MRKTIKIVLWSLLGISLLLFIAGGLFIYKARYGFNSYETETPELPENLSGKTVLLFSKTNGFRHEEAIEASIPAFKKLAKDNGWSLVITDNGAVFNKEQLQKFDVVVWNNTSGKVLNEEQREIFKNYLENGGGFVGIHASGDNSHQWDWYENEVLGAHFSHHPINPQFQEAMLYLEPGNSTVTKKLSSTWSLSEEWYMFFDNPRDKGYNVLYTVDEKTINPSGNIPVLESDKDWGMGADHPIVWCHPLKKGRVFYSALGHSGSTFNEPNYLQLLENAVIWAGEFN